MTSFLLLGGIVPEQAAAQGKWHGELFGGIYELDEDDTDRTEIFGLRAGYRVSPYFGLQATLGRIDFAAAVEGDDGPGLLEADLSIDVDVLDLSAQWFPGGHNFYLLAGPGIARLDFDADFPSIEGELLHFSDSEELLTAHAGIGYQWNLGESFYIRPEGRVRRYLGDDDLGDDDVSYEGTDREVTLAIGWRFGR